MDSVHRSDDKTVAGELLSTEHSTDTLRICLVHWTLAPTVGGVEAHLHDAASALARRGHAVTIVSGERRPTPIRGVDFVYAPALDVRRRRDATPSAAHIDSLTEVVIAVSADVVHGHNLHRFAPEVGRALDRARALVTGAAFHHTFHDVHLVPLDVLAAWDALHCASSFILERWRAATGDTVSFDTIPPGIDTAKFSAAPVPWERPTLLLHASRLVPWKGAHVSLDVLSHLRDRGIPATLLLTDTPRTADPPDTIRQYRQELVEGIRRSGLGGSVRLAKASHDMMPRLYADASVVLVPTLEEEPLGLVPLEAMSCRRAVVASRCGALPTTIADGVTGYLVTPGDASEAADRVVSIIRDSSAALAMGEAGRTSVVADHSLDARVDALVAAYRESRGRPSTTRP